MDTGIRSGEGIVGRQGRLSIRAGEVKRTGVIRDNLTLSTKCSDDDRKGATCQYRTGSTQREVVHQGHRRDNGDGGTPGESVRRIRSGNYLGPSREQGCSVRKGMSAIVGGDERIVDWQ